VIEHGGGLPNRSPIDEIPMTTRPWGSFEVLLSNAPATVKVITVAAGQRLSLQRHQARDELWQMLDGPVDVEVDGRLSVSHRGGRVWVPRGSTHRLGNSSEQSVRVLEVAFGEFDENDIERLEDDYERVTLRTTAP
jgi:mannose-6-phosphate isomerase